MQLILKWFTPVLALGVAIFIVFFLISINSQVELEEVKPLALTSEVAKKETKDTWLKHFSQTQRKGYFYPVNEVYIKVDLDKKIQSKRIYKLSASFLDPYQLFCLKEELKRHNLQYYLKKEADSLELLIYSQNLDKLKLLVKVLKNYQISATIRLYKEDI